MDATERMHAQQASDIRASLVDSFTGLSDEELRELRDTYGRTRSAVLSGIVWWGSVGSIDEVILQDALVYAAEFLHKLAPVFNPTLEI